MLSKQMLGNRPDAQALGECLPHERLRFLVRDFVIRKKQLAVLFQGAGGSEPMRGCLHQAFASSPHVLGYGWYM